MSAPPATESMFRDIGDITEDVAHVQSAAAASHEAAPAVDDAEGGAGGDGESDEDSEQEMEQGEPEAFVMNQVSVMVDILHAYVRVVRCLFVSIDTGMFPPFLAWWCCCAVWLLRPCSIFTGNGHG